MVSSARARVLVALFYLAIISYLFFLPGSAFPKNNWFSKVYFDKWVHIGFFFVLVVLWLWALNLFKKAMFILLIVCAAMYGLAVELVQDQFIPNRSFDVGDWMADMAGAFAGLWFWKGYIKNRPL
jgi:VanZ family protein